MKTTSLVCALVFASFATLAAQAPQLEARRITLLVVENTTFEAMMKVLGDISGVSIEFDEAVPAALRTAPVDRLHFQDTEISSALGFLTKRSNLAFDVTGSHSVRIIPKTAAPKR